MRIILCRQKQGTATGHMLREGEKKKGKMQTDYRQVNEEVLTVTYERTIE